MNRSDLQTLIELRVKEAGVLLDKGCFEGAYYLAGYAVECALKSCIAKRINQYDFPDLKLIRDSYTHDLRKLLVVAELRTELANESATNPDLAINWRTVTQWSEESRYLTKIEEQVARDLVAAITDENGGILPWLKKWW
jgi:HEPN domain-containing protein